MANLLDEASILLTPTAYNNGSMLAVKPENGDGDMTFSRNSAATRVNAQGLVENVQILSSNLVSNGDFSQEGSELVTNGDFSDGINGWQGTDSGSLLSVVLGELKIENGDGSAAGANSSITTEIGKEYRITFVSNKGSAINGIFFGAGTSTNSVNLLNVTDNFDGIHTGTFTATTTTTWFIAKTLSTVNGQFSYIDNVSVKEVGQDWTLGTSWSIGEDKANYDSSLGTSNIISSTLNITNGKFYKLKFNVISGNARLAFTTEGSQALFKPNGNGANNFSVGEYYFYLVAENSASALKIFAYNVAGGQDCSITNISVIEITDDTNLPRINYEGFSYDANGDIIPNSGCGSWLLEPQSTNIITYSENFSQWSIQRSNILSNQIIAPNGTLTAYKFYEQIDVNTNRYIYIRPTVTSGINYTQSIFAKKGERSWIFLESDGKGAYFDLENGVLGTVHSDITANIISMGNGWYKCSISKLSVATVPYLAYYIALSNNTKVYDGDGTSGIYLWGGQLEQNSYATSYIPTQGASSTRLQDIATNSGNASLINSEEGTLYAEISALANGGVSRVISINDGTYSMNNSILFSYSQGTNRLDVNGRVGGVYQFIFNRTITDTTINHKIAVVWKVNRFELWVDGVMTDQDLLGSVNSANTFTKLQLSNGNTSNPFYGKNKALAVYKTALTDAELTLLTTI